MVLPVVEGLYRGDDYNFMQLARPNPSPDTVEKIIETSTTSAGETWLQTLRGGGGDLNCTHAISIPFYILTIVTDRMMELSDDRIVGGIASVLANWSYAWREEKVTSGLLDSLETQGYEDSVVGEARRLGFGKEIDTLSGATADLSRDQTDDFHKF